MSRWRPVKRQDFIKKLKSLGFDGPFPGTNHHFMRLGTYTQTLPSDKEYSVDLLKRLLKQLETALNRTVTLKEWDGL